MSLARSTSCLAAVLGAALACAFSGCASSSKSSATTVVAEFNGYEVCARSSASVVSVESTNDSAKLQIGHWNLRVDKSRVSGAQSGDIALPAQWRRIEFIDKGESIDVVLDGQLYASIRPK